MSATFEEMDLIEFYYFMSEKDSRTNEFFFATVQLLYKNWTNKI